MPVNCFEFQICRAGEPCNCSQIRAKAASLYNADWLRRSCGNPSVLAALRGLARTAGTTVSDNESVVKLIAGQIASGQLRICQRQTAGPAGDPGGPSSTAPGAGKPFPFTPETKSTSGSSSQSSENDSPTMPEDMDATAQAAALNSAANQGAPFCPE